MCLVHVPNARAALAAICSAQVTMAFVLTAGTDLRARLIIWFGAHCICIHLLEPCYSFTVLAIYASKISDKPHRQRKSRYA